MKTDKRNIYIISIGSAIRTFGTGAMWVFTPLYLNNVLEVSLIVIGIVFAINAIFGGFIQIYAGHLGDRYGHRKIILLFASGYFITLFSLFFSAIFFPIPLLFIPLFLLNQIVGSLLMPSLRALLSLSSDIPLSGFSFMRVASNLGWAFGPAMGGVIISTFGYPYIYLVASISTLISLPLLFLLRDKRGEEKVTRGFSFKTVEKGIYSFGLGTAFLFVVVSQFTVTLSIYTNHIAGLGTTSIGLIYLVNGITVAVFQLPVYYVVRRIGLWGGMIMGSIIYVIGYFSIAFDTSLLQFIISMFIITMAENAVTPTASAMVSKISKNKQLGTHMGIYSFFMSFGRGFGPTYGTILLSFIINPFKIWGLAVIPAGIAGLIYLVLMTRERKEPTDASTPQS